MVAGTLSLDQIRNDAPETCTRLPGGLAPADIAAWGRGPCGATGAPERGTELLDDLLVGLLELPNEDWSRVIGRLPAELVDRLCNQIKAGAGQEIQVTSR